MNQTPAIAFLFASLLICTSTLADPTIADTMPEEKSKQVLLSVDDTWFHRLGLNRFTYKRALRRVGLQPIQINFHALSADTDDAVLAERLLRGMHGLVLAGGGDVDPALFGESAAFSLGVNTQRDRFELALLLEAERQGMPVFAICRGLQLLNVARGGSLRNLRQQPELIRAHKRRWGGHDINFSDDSRLARWLNVDHIHNVSTYHGQAIDRLGDGLRVAGLSPDGVIEAVENILPNEPNAFFGTVGVQWHPEVSPGESELKMFEAFAAAVRVPTQDAVELNDTFIPIDKGDDKSL